MKKPELSLVLPCYNETEHLEESVPAILQALASASTSYEVIFVEDASTDHTAELLEQILRNHKQEPVSILHHDRNRGHGRAVKDGILQACGAIVGYLDVDLEVPAHYIFAHLAAIREGADMTVAHRIYRFEFRALHRVALSRGYSSIARRMLRLKARDPEAGYKFFKRERFLPVLEQTTSDGWFWDTETVFLAERAGLRIVDIPSLYQRRKDKTTTVRLWHDSLKHARALWTLRRRIVTLRRQNPSCTP